MPTELDRWTAAAWELPAPRPLGLPLHVLLTEALDLVRFARANWEPTPAAPGRSALPGVGVIATQLLGPRALDDLVELVHAVEAAAEDYRLRRVRPPPLPRAEALCTLRELATSLQLLAKTEHSELGHVLALLHREYHRARCRHALATALFDYAELAERQEQRLDAFGLDTSELVTRARELCELLRDRDPVGSERREAAEALSLRQRLTTLLMNRIDRLRLGLRVVLAREPELRLRAGSAYRRTTQARLRARKKG